MGRFSKRSLDNLVGVVPELVELLTEAIKTCPQDFTIVEGVRTAKRQAELYAIGRTKPGHVVTTKDGYRNKSNHQVKSDGKGYAVDLYPYFNGSVQVQGPEVIKRLKIIAAHIKFIAACKGINLIWGGDWQTPYDPPHFEIRK